MTLKQIRDQIRLRLDDSSTDFFTDADINLAINESYEELSEESEWFERWANVNLLSNRNEYNLREIIPYEFVNVTRVYSKTTQRWLVPESKRILDDTANTEWELNDGDPGVWYIIGGEWLGVWPHPGGDSQDILHVFYTALPPRLANDDDEPDFPEEFQHALIHGALIELHMQQREPTAALENFAEYVQLESELKKYVDDRLKPDRRIVYGARA